MESTKISKATEQKIDKLVDILNDVENETLELYDIMPQQKKDEILKAASHISSAITLLYNVDFD